MSSIIEASGPDSWRQWLQPASFRRVIFHVEVGGVSSGRRVAEHEFAKRDVPWVEDMGRRVRRFPIQGYILVGPLEPGGPNYLPQRDALIEALEADGAGELIHPTLGSCGQVLCTLYNMTESREKGGYVMFDMMFIEQGSPASYDTVSNNAAQVSSQSVVSGNSVATALNNSLLGASPLFNPATLAGISLFSA